MGRTEKLIEKGLLTERRERMNELSIKIDRLIKDIHYYLLNFDGVDSIKVEHAEQAMAELVEAVRAYRAIKSELGER